MKSYKKKSVKKLMKPMVNKELIPKKGTWIYINIAEIGIKCVDNLKNFAVAK